MTYLDNNATTPLVPEVVEVMHRHLAETWGNPSSIHASGRQARRVLDDARDTVAQALGAAPRDVVFTGSGSEADTLGVVGSFLALRDRGRHIVTTAVEHSAVRRAVAFCERELGARVTTVPPDPEGRVSADAMLAAVEDDTVLVAMMAANNETGALLPVAAVAEACRARGIRTFTDAVQAVGKVEVRFDAWPVDLLSLSAHKFHGPKGAGVLLARRGVRVLPVVQGGGQERGLRPGTESVPMAAGLAEALRLAVEAVGAGAMDRVRALRDRLERGLADRIEGLVVNGPADPAERVPNTVNISVPGVEAEGLLITLDRAGVAASSGSACSSGSLEASPVLVAMGLDRERLQSSLRLSLSRLTTEAEVERALATIPEAVARLRQPT